MGLEKFKSGQRICFIGDSITAATYWIAHVADYYANNTNQKPHFYPCGISGGSCVSAYEYFDGQSSCWQADTAVIKLGMNDVGGEFYGENGVGGDLNKQAEVLADYKENLAKLIEKIKSYGISHVILLAPTPYDEMMTCDAKNHVGWMNGLRNCAKIMAQLAEQKGCEFFDLGGQMLDLLKGCYAVGNKNPLINADRVHPTPLGHAVMARIILAAQGFDELSVTPADIADGKACIAMSDKAKSFFEVAATLQKRWTADWLVADFSPDKSQAGKIKFIKEEYMLHPEKYGNYEKYGEYFMSLAKDYEALVLADNQNRARMVEANLNLFAR